MGRHRLEVVDALPQRVLEIGRFDVPDRRKLGGDIRPRHHVRHGGSS
jgi:hypothetical protein